MRKYFFIVVILGGFIAGDVAEKLREGLTDPDSDVGKAIGVSSCTLYSAGSGGIIGTGIFPGPGTAVGGIIGGIIGGVYSAYHEYGGPQKGSMDYTSKADSLGLKLGTGFED